MFFTELSGRRLAGEFVDPIQERQQGNPLESVNWHQQRSLCLSPLHVLLCRYAYILILLRKAGYNLKILILQDLASQAQDTSKSNNNNERSRKENNASVRGEVLKSSIDKLEEALHVKNASQGDIPFSGPLQVSTSGGFAWAKRRKEDAAIRSHSRSISRGHVFNAVEPSVALPSRNNLDLKKLENGDIRHRERADSKGHDSYEIAKIAIQNQWGKFERPDSFDASEGYHSQELSLALYRREEMGASKHDLVSM